MRYTVELVFEMQDVLLQRQSVAAQRQHVHPTLRHCDYDVDDTLFLIANNPQMTSNPCSQAPAVAFVPVLRDYSRRP